MLAGTMPTSVSVTAMLTPAAHNILQCSYILAYQCVWGISAVCNGNAPQRWPGVRIFVPQ